ncbi:ShlB/FhaC/HecB family hemolysin secretion/activation protein [Pseudoxanthomonas wuyuanensis]
MTHLPPRALWLALFASISPGTAGAQVPPNAGQSIRDIEHKPLQVPATQPLELALPETESVPASSDGPIIAVSRLRITGNQVFADSLLLPLLADLSGRNVSLGELQAGARRISSYYHRHGYPLTRAYLPAQEIAGGMVEIAILEGRYGNIELRNASRLRDDALAAPLAALAPGDAVANGPLERALLLLDDYPGVAVKSVLKPGEVVGTTDLLIDVQPTPLMDGSLTVDNYGNRFTGEYRLGAVLNVNSPLRRGDRFDLRVLGTDEQQHYYRTAYQLPLGSWSTRFGAAYSDLDYELAKDFRVLDAHGNARIASAFALQPLLRSRAFNLSAQLQFDDKRLRDDIDAYASSNRRRARVWSAGVSGDAHDRWLGGGITGFSATWSHGHLDFEDAQNRWLDALTAGTQGDFEKLNVSMLRLQRLSQRLSLYGQWQGQWASGNLDSVEKFGLGGAHGVRAYPQGEASGDQGWLANLELRYSLDSAWQVTTFLDHGRARINKDAWSADQNHRRLSAGGLGASWAGHGWRVDATMAWKLGNAEPRSDNDRTPRLWAQLARYF